MKALIVEPSKFQRFVLGSVFASNNVEVEATESASQALVALQRGDIDLVCFAHQLADGPGRAFFAPARSRGLVRNVPALLISSLDDPISPAELATEGIERVFDKRNPDALEAYVRDWARSVGERFSGRVLVIEDNARVADLYARQLQKIGLDVEIVASAEEGNDCLGRGNYDLVITDFQLQGEATGLSVVRHLRRMPAPKGNTPILVLSSFHDVSRKVEILRAGANDFVYKPVVNEEFEARVRNLLTLRQLLHRLEEQHRIVKDMATRDRLTSLHNRHYLEERLPQLLADTAAENKPLSLVMVDVDHFKRVNDTYGHPAGDQVLISLAPLLSAYCRHDELAIRMGGEEFLLVLPRMDRAAAAMSAERLRYRIEHLCPAGLKVTASLGVATRIGNEPFAALLSRVDAAVYRAKEGGRNQVVIDEA